MQSMRSGSLLVDDRFDDVYRLHSRHDPAERRREVLPAVWQRTVQFDLWWTAVRVMRRWKVLCGEDRFQLVCGLRSGHFLLGEILHLLAVQGRSVLLGEWQFLLLDLSSRRHLQRSRLHQLLSMSDRRVQLRRWREALQAVLARQVRGERGQPLVPILLAGLLLQLRRLLHLPRMFRRSIQRAEWCEPVQALSRRSDRSRDGLDHLYGVRRRIVLEHARKQRVLDLSAESVCGDSGSRQLSRLSNWYAAQTLAAQKSVFHDFGC